MAPLQNYIRDIVGPDYVYEQHVYGELNYPRFKVMNRH